MRIAAAYVLLRDTCIRATDAIAASASAARADITAPKAHSQEMRQRRARFFGIQSIRDLVLGCEL